MKEFVNGLTIREFVPTYAASPNKEASSDVDDNIWINQRPLCYVLNANISTES